MLMDASWISRYPDVKVVINSDASLLADAYDTVIWNAIFRPLNCDATQTKAGTCYGVVFDDLFLSLIERVIRQTLCAVNYASVDLYYFTPLNRNITLSDAQADPVTLPTWRCRVNKFIFTNKRYVYTSFADQSLGDIKVYCEMPLFSITQNKYAAGSTTEISFQNDPTQYVQSDIWARLEYITQMYSIYQSVLARYVPVRARTVDVIPVSDNLHQIKVNVASSDPYAIRFDVKDLTAKQAIMYYFDMMKLQDVRWVDPLSPLKSIKIEYDIQFPDDDIERIGL